MNRLIPLALCGPLIALAACTPAEIRAWQAWHTDDPEAAIAYANQPEIQARLQEASQVATQSASSLRNVQGDGVWNKIARCESGGRWDYPPVTNSSGTYSGGLMIGHRWWPKLGGQEFAPWPYLATRAEQIHIAEKIVDTQGLDRGWQCWP